MVEANLLSHLLRWSAFRIRALREQYGLSTASFSRSHSYLAVVGVSGRSIKAAAVILQDSSPEQSGSGNSATGAP
jgi:hypothetical protein